MSTPDLTISDDGAGSNRSAVASGSRNSGREAIRYLVASIAALGLDATILSIGVSRLDLPVWFAGAIAYFGGLVLVYLLSIHWVFAQRAVHKASSEFLIFAALGLLGLFLNSVTLYVGTALGLGLVVAKGLSAGIGFAANFVTRKVLLFSRGG